MAEPREGLGPKPSWWRRAYYTPVSDALRGQLTARLDVRKTIANANLPAPISLALYDLVRSARLSRAARIGLTEQLIARCTSELATGRTAAEVAIELESPEQVARFIERSRLVRKSSRRWAAKKEIALAELPQPIEALVVQVVNDTRLWPREKLDVARELVSHFADGLAAGRTAEQLIEDFGAAKPAAKLIRQSKIRGRSRAWHAYRMAKRAMLVMLGTAIVGYAVLSARFFWGRPSIAKNYWTELNDLRRAPETDRAWPLYREALFKLGKEDFTWTANNSDVAYHTAEERSRLHAVLDRHADVLDLVRAGAAKSQFGSLLGDPDDAAEAKAAGATWVISGSGPMESENAELYSGLLEGLQGSRALEVMLIGDALRAAESGDGARAETDIVALLSMSEQIMVTPGFLVEQLVALAFFNEAVKTVGQILRDHPQAFSEAQLRNLAHRISAYQGGTIALDVDSERRMFADVLQRVYTDDGRGDGRVTREGLKTLNQLVGPSMQWNGEANDPRAALVFNLAMPAAASLIGSRKENREFYNSLMDRMIAAHQGPSWDWDLEAIHGPMDALRATAQGLDKLRYMLVNTLLPAVNSVFDAAEYSTQLRDATLVALALELWHRRHDAWPTSLAQLVPDLLPVVPPDRADGKPLRYANRDGKPVVYSLGFDRDDDGGVPASNSEHGRIFSFGPVAAEELKRIRDDADDQGDWVLWPPLVEEPPKEDEPAAEVEDEPAT